MRFSSDHRFVRVVFAAALSACGGGGAVTDAPQPCAPVDMTYPGSVSGTVSANGCISGGFPAALYRFASDPTSTHRFSATSNFATLGFEVMSDPPGENVVWASNVSSIDATWLLPAGTFLLRVSVRTTGVEGGTFTVTGSRTPLNTSGCTVRTLVVGLTLRDQVLAPTDCRYEDEDGTFYDAFGIQSAKPCTIRMSSATVDPFLVIRNARQSEVVTYNDDVSDASSDAFVSLTSCSHNGGPIVIVANTAAAESAFGDYTLTVEIQGGGSIAANELAVTPLNPETDAQRGALGRAVIAKPAKRRH